VWAETPSNPTLFITDIAGLAEVAHAHRVPLIVDNTLVTPWLQQPLALGADIVVLSLTKALSGNGTVVGGAVVGQEALIADMLKNTLPYMGATMSPFDAWLTLLSLETLPARMDCHSANAERVADYLAQHPSVIRVYYPSHADPTQQELAKRQMPKGYGGMLSFVVHGGKAAAARVMDSFKMIAIGPSFGTTRSVANHPTSFTHHTMKPEEREAVGIADGLIRLSVGLERPDDIIAELEQALAQL
jgi:cystathionine beta-lyase/cystathionine gamma-synthase